MQLKTEALGMLSVIKTENSPFSEQQIIQLRQSLGQLDPGQSAWLSGYLAGRLASGSQSEALAPLPVAAQLNGEQGVLHVFYASQTGNGEDLAQGFVSQAAGAGLAVKSRSLNELKPAQLKKLDHAVFIISTHGEGDPPDDALDLFEYLESARAPQLDTLRFRVLALGDRSYSQFCEAGRKLEELLLARGARTFAERVDCDLDYQTQAGQWSAEVIEYGSKELARAESGAVLAPATVPAPHLSVVPSTAEWNRKRPYTTLNFPCRIPACLMSPVIPWESGPSTIRNWWLRYSRNWPSIPRLKWKLMAVFAPSGSCSRGTGN
jgi:sulfite reductase (NADPH) flavoprotein alpha-component